MKLYNTLTKKVEDFVPNEENRVKMYTCGPTVYHFAHIGNLRTYIMEDVLERFLRFSGYDVTRVMNITDVGHLSSDGDTGEDKMLKYRHARTARATYRHAEPRAQEDSFEDTARGGEEAQGGTKGARETHETRRHHTRGSTQDAIPQYQGEQRVEHGPHQ